MAYPVKFDQGRSVAQFLCSLDECFRLREWNGIVGRSMDQNLSRAGWKKFDWRACIVPIWMFFRCSTHEPRYDTMAEFLPPSQT